MSGDLWLQLRVSEIRAGWRQTDRVYPRWTAPRDHRPARGLTLTDWLVTGVLVLLLIVAAQLPLWA